MLKEKLIANKKFFIFGGVVLFLGILFGGYSMGKNFFGRKENNRGEFIQMEDGRKVRLENAGGSLKNNNNNDQRANLTGKIKSIQGSEITIEKFAMPGERMGAGGQAPADRDGAQLAAPTMEGVAIVIVGSTTELVKSQRGMGRPGQEQKTEKISQEDLVEGAIISVWSKTEEGSEKELATKIMMRTN